MTRHLGNLGVQMVQVEIAVLDSRHSVIPLRKCTESLGVLAGWRSRTWHCTCLQHWPEPPGCRKGNSLREMVNKQSSIGRTSLWPRQLAQRGGDGNSTQGCSSISSHPRSTALALGSVSQRLWVWKTWKTKRLGFVVTLFGLCATFVGKCRAWPVRPPSQEEAR